MNKRLLPLGLVLLVGGCSAFRMDGPSEGEVGKVFSWKLADEVAVSDTGCPDSADVDGLRRRLPGSYLFVRLDSLSSATNMDCSSAFNMSTCTEFSAETATYFPVTLDVSGSTFTGAVESRIKELSPGCALMLYSTLVLDDQGNHGTLELGMTFEKEDVLACATVQLVGSDGTPVEKCDVDVAGELSLINVGDP